jgi:hypothetical protein
MKEYYEALLLNVPERKQHLHISQRTTEEMLKYDTAVQGEILRKNVQRR